MKDYEIDVVKRSTVYRILKKENTNLNEKTLLEMADTKIKILQRLDIVWTTIVEHLLKLYLYRYQVQDYEVIFWYQIIRGQLFWLPELKGKSSNNGRLEADDIFYRTFIVWEDTLEESMPRRLKELKQKYSILKTPDSLNTKEFNEFYNIVKEYFTWISQQLSSKETVSENEVKEKLNQLFKVYY